MVATVIEEPGGLLSSDEATLEIGRRRDGMLAHPHGAKEWVPPQRPSVLVVQSIRGDPFGKMFARHQVSRVHYLAGRGYQELHGACQAGQLRSADPSRPFIQGGRCADFVTDCQRAAARKLRNLDQVVLHELGLLGLSILRIVLVECRPLAIAGERTGADRRTRGYLFNAALTTVAVKLGLATAALHNEGAAKQRRLAGR
jgi:hypothetical protein